VNAVKHIAAYVGEKDNGVFAMLLMIRVLLIVGGKCIQLRLVFIIHLAR